MQFGTPVVKCYSCHGPGRQEATTVNLNISSQAFCLPLVSSDAYTEQLQPGLTVQFNVWVLFGQNDVGVWGAQSIAAVHHYTDKLEKPPN